MAFLILAVITFVIFFSGSKVTIGIELKRTGENDRLIVSFSVLRGAIKFDIPLVGADLSKDSRVGRLYRKIRRKQTFRGTEKKETSIRLSQIKEWIENIYGWYRGQKEILESVREYIQQKVICKELSFVLNFGLGDAALTGVASGMVWGVAYNVLAIIKRYVILEKTDIKVNPDFNELKLHIKLNSIFVIRIVHIIIVFFILLYSTIKFLIRNKQILKPNIIKNKAV